MKWSSTRYLSKSGIATFVCENFSLWKIRKKKKKRRRWIYERTRHIFLNLPTRRRRSIVDLENLLDVFSNNLSKLSKASFPSLTSFTYSIRIRESNYRARPLETMNGKCFVVSCLHCRGKKTKCSIMKRT